MPPDIPCSQRQQDPHAAVRSTDDDAAASRLSCVQLGYLNDPFARFFVKRAATRPPVINIGTHARNWAVDALVHAFVNTPTGRPKQIVSLGAGSDTRYFKMKRLHPEQWDLARYVEIDFEESTSKKALVLKRNDIFEEVLGSNVTLTRGGAGLSSPVYHLLPADLSQLPDELGRYLLQGDQPLLDPTYDTLFLAECVFIYLDPSLSTRIARWCCDAFASSMMVLYDPIKFQDAFGQMMISNLQRRQIDLKGISTNESIQTVKQRLEQCGFSFVQAEDVAFIRKKRIPLAEKERLSKLELVDEYEELDLLLSHYAVAWATNTSAFQHIRLA